MMRDGRQRAPSLGLDQRNLPPFIFTLRRGDKKKEKEKRTAMEKRRSRFVAPSAWRVAVEPSVSNVKLLTDYAKSLRIEL